LKDADSVVDMHCAMLAFLDFGVACVAASVLPVSIIAEPHLRLQCGNIVRKCKEGWRGGMCV
jgi:hypothetical protein